MMHSYAILSTVFLLPSLVFSTLSTLRVRDIATIQARQGYGYGEAAGTTVRVAHQFPVGTWVEDFAFRRNAQILTTALSSPEIFQVDNRGVRPIKLVHTFSNATSCTAITMMGHDVFYVIAGNFSLSTFSAVPGSWSVYRVNVHHIHPLIGKPKPARVTWVANFPDSIMLSGITVLNKRKRWLLVSDSGAGVVYRLEVKTGKVFKVLEDPLMKPDSSSSGIGIRTMHIKRNVLVKDDQLYFTNPSQKILARIRLQNNGTSRIPANVVSHLDDPYGFTFTHSHNHISNRKVLVAQNRVDRLESVDGNVNLTLTGIGNNTKLFGPTAVRLSITDWRLMPHTDPSCAFMSTNGGTAQYLTGNLTRGGTISYVYFDLALQQYI